MPLAEISGRDSVGEGNRFSASSAPRVAIAGLERSPSEAEEEVGVFAVTDTRRVEIRFER
jgi:hypothetical protein